MQALLSELVSYLIKYVFLIFTAFVGVQAGIRSRKKKNSKSEN